MFEEEAEKYDVFPLDDRFVERGVNPDRPSFVKGRTTFSYEPGTVRIPEGNAPPIYQRSHTITAKVTIPEGGASGVLIATGGGSGGYTLYIDDDGRPVYDYNYFGQERYRIEGKDALPPGDHVIVLDYEQKPFVPFKEVTGGPAVLSVDGVKVADGEVGSVVPARFSATETLDIGMDLGAPVSRAYEDKAPFAFDGKLDTVTVELKG